MDAATIRTFVFVQPALMDPISAALSSSSYVYYQEKSKLLSSFLFCIIYIWIFSWFHWFCQSFFSELCQSFVGVCQSFVRVCQSLSEFVRVCQSFVRVLSEFLRVCQSISEFCQSFSEFVRVLSEFVRVLSEFCQSLSEFCQSFVRVCQSFVRILSEFRQSLSEFCQSFRQPWKKLKVMCPNCYKLIKINGRLNNFTLYWFLAPGHAFQESIHCHLKVSRPQTKIDENFANYFLKLTASAL